MTTTAHDAPATSSPDRDQCWCGMPFPLNPLALCYGPADAPVRIRPHAPAEREPEQLDRRLVDFHMAGEDFRALLARVLLFAGDPRSGLAAVRVEVSPYWATAVATDGHALAVQKMRVEADAEGAFMLSTYDAERMLKMIPKPHQDEQLGDVHVEFVTGADLGPFLVNMNYVGEDDRALTYACHGLNPAEFPPYRKLLELDLGASIAEPRFIVQPAFMSLIAKAELAAKDQTPFVVRWHLVSSDFGPRVYATFNVNEQHDEFAAALMPLVLEWHERDDLAAVLARLTDTSAPSARAFPLQSGIAQ